MIFCKARGRHEMHTSAGAAYSPAPLYASDTNQALRPLYTLQHSVEGSTVPVSYLYLYCIIDHVHCTTLYYSYYTAQMIQALTQARHAAQVRLV